MLLVLILEMCPPLLLLVGILSDYLANSPLRTFSLIYSNMSKTLLSMVLALGFLLPVSCDKITEATPQTSPVGMIGAYYTEIEEPDVKNSITNLNWTVGWSSGDAIAVVNLGTGAIAKYTIQSSYVGKNYGIFDHAEGNAGDGELVAVYPYSAASWEDGTLYVTLDDDVVYNANSSYASGEKPAFATNDIQITAKMSAADLSNELRFYRMVSLLTVTANVSLDEFQGENVSEAVISVDGESRIAGKAPVVFTGTVPSVSRNSSTLSQLSIKLTATTMISSANYIVRFIPVFPYNMSNGFRFEFLTDEYQMGFYRKISWNAPVNNNVNFVLFPGGFSQVFSREEATSDHTWWYSLKEGGLDQAGSYDGGNEMGSSAGGFED